MVLTKLQAPNVHILNERGFTIAEMLVVFTAFCMLMAFLPLGVKMVLQHNYLDSRVQRLEWEVFNTQLKRETRISTRMTVDKDKLLLYRNGESVLFEKYDSAIRRRVNYTGHEIILQNVASLAFSPRTNGYCITVKDMNGKEYTATIRSFSVQGGEDEK
ncbi:competence type IV pilus minor pilin ComGF [Mesobacillus foraminis]|uniref:competence type IV pilus minor pilin ComGF n=1 Tax=Mesobacillus foraminis TaxID=279826 RepID=UPI000EF485C4|nr:competence type IV pilus minor pilin ComGF [Mesobacillus foraminis]